METYSSLKVAGGLTLSWAGTFTSLATVFAENLHAIAALVGVLFSVIGTLYAIRVSKATLHNRAVELAHTCAALCKDCIAGNPPPICPLGADSRPHYCPKRQDHP